MLKVIHAADLHLDSPFSGLPPEKAAQRRAEQRELPERLAGLARERSADLILLAGDLFDSERVFRETVQALARGLSAAPCPVFIAPGNHDFFSPRSPYAALDWPDNVHIFSTGEVERFDLPELNCAVWGRAFTGPHREDSPLAGFSAPRDGLLHLMALHGDTAPASRYGPVSPKEIAGSGLNYLALGHVHQHSGLQMEGCTFWAYPGCPEGRGFDETGGKGVLYLEVEPDKVKAEFVPLCRRRYELLTVDLTGSDPLSAVRAALPPDTEEDIYRVILTGEGEAADLPALERELAPRFYALSLRDRTRLPQDLWARRGEDSLTGLFLQIIWEKFRQDPEDQTAQLAARFGLAALENGEDPAP